MSVHFTLKNGRKVLKLIILMNQPTMPERLLISEDQEEENKGWWLRGRPDILWRPPKTSPLKNKTKPKTFAQFIS